jgi:putative adenylate-forming enzyme
MNVLSRLLMVAYVNHRFYHWDKTALSKHQQRRIAAVLGWAREKSTYYRRLPSGQEKLSFSSVPLIDKNEMMAHFDEINTARLRRDQLVKFRIEQERTGKLDLYQGKFSVGLSSGTSGNRGLTVLSKDEMARYSCLLWARSGITRSVKRRRILFALRTNNPTFMRVASFGAKLIYVDYTHPSEELVGLINREELNILAGPPSLLTMIAQHRASIRHHIDAIVSYAEVLTDETRSNLEQALDAPVTQIYQGAEGFIASTCHKGKLHLNEDIVLVELNEAGDTIGNARKVVVTDLYRTTQPVIRYALNDVLEVSNEPCTCGSCFRVVERIHGRADDVFLLRGPGEETRYLFPDYVQRSIIFASDDILEYQAIQRSIDLIEIRLLLKEGAGAAAIEGAILDNLKRWADKAGGRLGEVRFSRDLPQRNSLSRKLIRVVRTF